MLQFLNKFRVSDGDEFIRNLWDVHTKVKAEGYTQAGVFRFN
jgi:hypothetical protein